MTEDKGAKREWANARLLSLRHDSDYATMLRIAMDAASLLPAHPHEAIQLTTAVANHCRDRVRRITEQTIPATYRTDREWVKGDWFFNGAEGGTRGHWVEKTVMAMPERIPYHLRDDLQDWQNLAGWNGAVADEAAWRLDPTSIPPPPRPHQPPTSVKEPPPQRKPKPERPPLSLQDAASKYLAFAQQIYDSGELRGMKNLWRQCVSRETFSEPTAIPLIWSREDPYPEAPSVHPPTNALVEAVVQRAPKNPLVYRLRADYLVSVAPDACDPTPLLSVAIENYNFLAQHDPEGELGRSAHLCSREAYRLYIALHPHPVRAWIAARLPSSLARHIETLEIPAPGRPHSALTALNHPQTYDLDLAQKLYNSRPHTYRYNLWRGLADRRGYSALPARPDQHMLGFRIVQSAPANPLAHLLHGDQHLANLNARRDLYGCDLHGAVSAYKRVIELDPKGKLGRHALRRWRYACRLYMANHETPVRARFAYHLPGWIGRRLLTLYIPMPNRPEPPSPRDSTPSRQPTNP